MGETSETEWARFVVGEALADPGGPADAYVRRVIANVQEFARFYRSLPASVRAGVEGGGRR